MAFSFSFLPASVLISNFLARRALADLNVTSWSSPISGASYTSSQVLQTVFYSDEDLSDSLGFRLCSSERSWLSEDADASPGGGVQELCGDLVWPDVQHHGNTLFTELILPNVTREKECYLQVEDCSGDAATSPAFFISPTESQQTLRRQVLAAEVASPSSSSSPSPSSSSHPLLTDDQEFSTPSRAIIYIIPLTFVFVITFTGICIYLYSLRRAPGTGIDSSESTAFEQGRNGPNSSSGYSSTSTAIDDEKFDSSVSRTYSLDEKRGTGREGIVNMSRTSLSDPNDTYTSLYVRSLPLQHQQSRPQTTSPPPLPPPPPKLLGPRRPRRSTVPARLFKNTTIPENLANVNSIPIVSRSGNGASSDEAQRSIPCSMTCDRIGSGRFLPPPSRRLLELPSVA